MESITKLIKNNFLVTTIVGMLLGIASTLKRLDTNSTGSDDVIGQSLQSFAEVLSAVQADNASKTITALKALVAAANSWIDYLTEKEVEKNSSGTGKTANVPV